MGAPAASILQKTLLRMLHSIICYQLLQELISNHYVFYYSLNKSVNPNNHKSEREKYVQVKHGVKALFMTNK